MSANKLTIPKVGFPDQTASDSVKESHDFGLSVGKAIMHEWFSRTSGKSRFYTNKDKLTNLAVEKGFGS